MKKTTFAFFGSSHFSAIILKYLIDNKMMPTVVVCNPDREVGRHKILTAPLTKQIAEEHAITIYQPEKLSADDWKKQFEQITFDCFVVAAYAKIIPQELLDIPKQGSINVHPSLLPLFRGASPIQTAILEGVPSTGVTIFKMDKKVDHGPILAKSEAVAIENSFYTDMEYTLAIRGAELLIETLTPFLEKEITEIPQDDTRATFTKKFTTEDGHIPFDTLEKATSGNDPETATAIERKIRALTPEPGVWVQAQNAQFGDINVKNKRVKLLESLLQDGRLVITQIQVEGKTPIRIKDAKITGIMEEIVE